MLVWVLLLSIGSIHYALGNSRLPTQVVILQYHHVDDNTPAITSVSPETFKSHMQYIHENFEVVSLQSALNAIKSNSELPQNAIAITFDDGYFNILENAHPILVEYGFPYTIFINPSSIGKIRGQLTWEQIKGMQPLADFANHTLDHLHLLQHINGESESQWLKRVLQNIEQAEQEIEKQLGYSHRWLAYPFGEFNSDLKNALRNRGYIAFGQQSGSVAAYSDFAALPRFPASGRYSTIETLKVKMASLAMPVLAHQPAGYQRQLGDTMEVFSFTLMPNSNDVGKGQLACFFKGERKVPLINGDTVLVELNHAFTPGRVRINCTAPSKATKGRFYWHSVPFFTPTAKGVFLD